MIVASLLWFLFTTFILIYALREKKESAEDLAVLPENANGRRTIAEYFNEGASYDVLQIVLLFCVTFLALSSDFAYSHLSMIGDEIWRWIIRSLLIGSLIPFLLRMKGKRKLRQYLRENSEEARNKQMDAIQQSVEHMESQLDAEKRDRTGGVIHRNKDLKEHQQDREDRKADLQERQEDREERKQDRLFRKEL